MRRAAGSAALLLAACSPATTTWLYDGAPFSVVVQQDGRPAGRSVWLGPQGRLAAGDLVGQQRQGIWKTWYPGGGLQEVTVWRDDVQDGPSRTFWPDGRLQCAGEFARGRRVGEWRFFRPDGCVDAERSGFYEDGVRR